MMNDGRYPTDLAIYGAGGFGREVAWLAQICSAGQERYRVVCFIDDNQDLHGMILNTIPVVGLKEARAQFAGARVVLGVGSPPARQRLAEKVADSGFSFETLIHPRVERSPGVEIGAGTVVCAGNVLTVNIALGQHVHVNPNCTIGHDVVIGDFTTVAPGAHISGWVRLGRRVWVGAGAVIVNGTQERPLSVGDDAVIGAGACVTAAVSPGLTVVGVPARPLLRK